MAGVKSVDAKDAKKKERTQRSAKKRLDEKLPTHPY
jgi:hypothetical protein